jgi:hypothetical protein
MDNKMTAKEILKDEKFRKLPEAEQIKVLSIIDAKFKALSPSEQKKVIGSAIKEEKTVDVSKMRVRIHDNGLFMPLARRLAESFGTVEYFVDYEAAYTSKTRHSIGQGIPDIKRIDSFFKDKDKVDIFAFFDIGRGDIQDDLRKQGFPVFGSGYAEVLEQDRVGFKEILKSVGLPVDAYIEVTGIDELHDALEKTKNKWVKISKFRGISDTFHHKDYRHSVGKIDQIAAKLGADRKTQKFIIEDHIEGVELGDDRFFSNGIPLPIGSYGFEIKDLGYIAQFMRIEDMPDAVNKVHDALAPIYKKYNLSSMMSTEIRNTPDNRPHYNDCCARAGSPPSEITSEGYVNLDKMINACAKGEMITPKPIKKYAAEVLIRSDMAASGEWVPINCPKNLENRWKGRNLCRVDGQYYHIPQDGIIIVGASIGLGDTLKEAQEEALAVAEQIECPDKVYDPNVFEEADKQLEIATKKGLGFR